MPHVLTVDDSKAIRTMVSKQMEALGCDISEAENGEEGLLKLQELKFDLVLLDVTMPVLDGPGMLKRMREMGDKTPVIMLTSESKSSIIGEAMRLGINDYILKPFKPEEIREKALKVVRGADASARPIVKDATVAAPVAPGAVAEFGTKPFVDVLAIDDMENVHKRLRALLPADVTFNSAANASASLQICREKVFRCVLIDTTLPDIDSVALMHQLRVLQPHASFVSMPLRATEGAEQQSIAQGFAAALAKPFDPDTFSDFFAQFFDNQELVTVDADHLLVAGFTGKEERIAAYFTKIKELVLKAIDELAAACFEDVLLDLSAAPFRRDRSVRLLIDLDAKVKSLGLRLKLVGTAEAKKHLEGVLETATIPFFLTVTEARQ